MSPEICKLSHVALVTPDIDRSLEFFSEVLGLEEVERDGDRIYLRCWGELDHHSVSLREGPTGVEHVAFRASRPEDVAGFRQHLTGLGLNVETVPPGEERGQGEAIRFVAPHAGHPIELVHEIERPLAPEAIRSRLPTASSRLWGTGIGPRRLDHVNLATVVDEVQPADEWLQEHLGFRRREVVQPTGSPVVASWLSVTALVHDLALTPDPEGQPGMFHHLAFAMEAATDLLRAGDILSEHRIKIDASPGRHGITQGFFLYFRDPGSGHRVELFSGGYLIFDPDWEPIVWDEDGIEVGQFLFGPPFRLGEAGHPMTPTTPCLTPDRAATGLASV